MSTVSSTSISGTNSLSPVQRQLQVASGNIPNTINDGSTASSSSTTSSGDSVTITSAVQEQLKLYNLQQGIVTPSTTGSTDASSSTDYTDQDWYITAKVSQLKDEINTYNTLPGLDPSGSIMDSLTKEVNDLVDKENTKKAAEQAKEDAAQKQLDDQQAAAALAAQHPSVDTMLARAKAGANGEVLAPYSTTNALTIDTSGDTNVTSSDDMLAKVRGSNVNTTA